MSVTLKKLIMFSFSWDRGVDWSLYSIILRGISNIIKLYYIFTHIYLGRGQNIRNLINYGHHFLNIMKAIWILKNINGSSTQLIHLEWAKSQHPDCL